MAAIDTQTLLAFEDEFEKNAGPLGSLLARAAPLASKYGPRAMQFLRRGAGSAGAGLGVGAAGGAVVGGGAGAYQGYQKAKEEGGSGLGGALGGFGSGAARGAAVGGALGAAGGLAAGGRGMQLGKSLENVGLKDNALGSLARFGQRQVHGLTGLVPGGSAARGTEEYAKAMGNMRFASGSAEAAKGVTTAAKALEGAKAGGNPKMLEKATKALQGAQGKADIAREAEEKGLTSLPGIVKSLGSKQGLKDTWRLGIKPQLTQQGGMGKAMAALPLAFSAPELLHGAEQDPEGRGRGERFAGSLGQGLGYAAAPFAPLVATEGLSRGAGLVGKGVGRGIDKLIGAVRSKSKPSPMQELGNNPSAPGVDPSGMNEAVPRMYSNAALGKPPEGMMV